MTTVNMNKRQEAALNAVKNSVLYGNREVKKLEVTGNEFDNDVYVCMEVGRKDDEGTMAESLCRDCYCFNIGTGGGIYVYKMRNQRDGKKGRTYRVYKKCHELESIW